MFDTFINQEGSKFEKGAFNTISEDIKHSRPYKTKLSYSSQSCYEVKLPGKILF